ncbi:MAG: hypothetical protein K8R53_01395, partial [Bacteroidales bacterium]|nr:hypothetical protein [Bacteroidales bacterium]
MFDYLPSYGLFIRHAENITLKNIELHFQTDDLRPPLYLEDIENGLFFDITADINASVPFIHGSNLRNIFIKNPWPGNPCSSVIEIKGEQSKSIKLSDIDKRWFNEIFKTSSEVDRGVVRLGNIF